MVAGNEILLIDDDVQTRRALRRVLEAEQYSVQAAGTAKEARISVEKNFPDIVLLDLGLPDANGVDVLEYLLEEGVGQVIVVSGTSSAEITRQCLRKGAYDFILKPASRDDLLQAIRRATSSYQTSQIRTQEYPTELKPGFGALETPSQISQRMFDLLRRIAINDNVNALITGPAGLFKRDIAALLHHHTRRSGPALLINCALETDDDSVARFVGNTHAHSDRTRMGYIKQAEQGTLVLDDLSLLPICVQDVLVDHIRRAKEVKERARTPNLQPYCSIVGILKEPTEAALSTGRLQSALHAALASNLITVPALEERPEDVGFFASNAVSQLNTLLGSEKSLSHNFVEFLTAQHWEGNLIELKNRLLTVYRGTEDGEDMIYDPLLWPQAINRDVTLSSNSLDISPFIGLTLSEAESRLIMATLASVDDNKTKASQILGISVKTLYNRLKN